MRRSISPCLDHAKVFSNHTPQPFSASPRSWRTKARICCAAMCKGRGGGIALSTNPLRHSCNRPAAVSKASSVVVRKRQFRFAALRRTATDHTEALGSGLQRHQRRLRLGLRTECRAPAQHSQLRPRTGPRQRPADVHQVRVRVAKIDRAFRPACKLACDSA